MTTLKILWGVLRGALLEAIRKTFSKANILRYLKDKITLYIFEVVLNSAIKGGFQTWLVTFLIDKGFEKVIVPAVNLAYRKGLFIVDKQNGKIKYKKLVKAKDENDEDTYIDVLSGV